MQLVEKWLAGSRNFEVGRILYNQLGGDEKLKQLFQGPATPLKQKRLLEALQALATGKPTRQAPTSAPGAHVDQMPESTDPVLKALRAEWLPLYQRMNYLRHELDRYEGNTAEAIAARSPIAFEVLELEQACIRIWARRRHYEQHGWIPEVKAKEAPLPDDPLELARLVESVKRNLRRNRQLAKQHPDNPVYPARVQQYQAELDRINKTVSDGKAKG